jgi:GT2 family glycosyltransferase
MEPADVIVVMNSDAPVPTGELDRYRIIRELDRRGYGAACNRGFAELIRQHADHFAVVFLNDDTVVSEGWQDALGILRDERVGALGFTVHGPNGMGRSRSEFPYQYDPGYREHTSPTLDGCAIGIRSEVFCDAGGFDESFGMYGEETDLFARLMARGYTLVQAPTSLFHEGEGTMQHRSVARSWYGMRNPLVVQLLNGTLRSFLRAVVTLIAHAVLPRAVAPSDEPHVLRKRSLVWPLRVILALGALLWVGVSIPRLLLRRWGRCRRGDLNRLLSQLEND